MANGRIAGTEGASVKPAILLQAGAHQVRAPAVDRADASAPAAASADSAILRRKAFVDAGRTAFFTQGYAGTTMSSIASKVGGSKTTLWTYFPSKEDLFVAVVDDIVDQYGDALSIKVSLDDDVFVTLRRFADVLMATLLSEPILALNRLVIGEAHRFPHLAALFYERGPRRGKRRLADYLEASMARDALRPGDPALVAQQFTGACQSGVYQKALLGLPEGRDESQLEKDIEMAMDCFRRTWAPVGVAKALLTASAEDVERCRLDVVQRGRSAG